MTDRIVTHPANDAYRTGYDAIFGKAQQTRDKPSSEGQASSEQMQAGAGQNLAAFRTGNRTVTHLQIFYPFNKFKME